MVQCVQRGRHLADDVAADVGESAATVIFVHMQELCVTALVKAPVILTRNAQGPGSWMAPRSGACAKTHTNMLVQERLVEATNVVQPGNNRSKAFQKSEIIDLLTVSSFCAVMTATPMPRTHCQLTEQRVQVQLQRATSNV